MSQHCSCRLRSPDGRPQGKGKRRNPYLPRPSFRMVERVQGTLFHISSRGKGRLVKHIVLNNNNVFNYLIVISFIILFFFHFFPMNIQASKNNFCFSFIYLHTPGLSCFLRNLQSWLWPAGTLVVACKIFSLWHAESLVAVLELLVVICGIQFPNQGSNLGPLH